MEEPAAGGCWGGAGAMQHLSLQGCPPISAANVKRGSLPSWEREKPPAAPLFPPEGEEGSSTNQVLRMCSK